MIKDRKVTSVQLKRRAVSTLIGTAMVFGVPALISGNAVAQQYPTKPIKIVVPYAAGGTTDAVARIIGKELSERLGQPVLVENRPGAGARIGTEYLAKSAADGYTLEYTVADPLSVIPHIFRNVPYDALKDFTPVGMVGIAPMGLAASANVPVNSLPEFIKYAKANPGKLSFGSWGIGSGAHIRTEAFKAFTQTDLLHVPFQGAGPAFAALLGGHVDVLVAGVGLVASSHKAGKIKVLAVDTAERDPALPDVPTFSEQNVKLNLKFWNGVIAPANVPEPIINRLNKELAATVSDPRVREGLTKAGMVVTPGEDGIAVSPAEVRKYYEAEYARWGKVIRDAKITAE